jgi:hypothetical protein
MRSCKSSLLHWFRSFFTTMHVVRMSVKKLNEWLSVEVLSHPPHSSDISSTDFHFFRSLDRFLRQKHIKNVRDVKIALEQVTASMESNFYINEISAVSALELRWQRS